VDALAVEQIEQFPDTVEKRHPLLEDRSDGSVHVADPAFGEGRATFLCFFPGAFHCASGEKCCAFMRRDFQPIARKPFRHKLFSHRFAVHQHTVAIENNQFRCHCVAFMNVIQLSP